MKYILELDEEQARITKAALEFYARIVIGQWQMVGELCLDPKDDRYAEKLDVLRAGMYTLRCIAYPDLPPGASYGVAAKEKSLAAWEVMQVLRHCIAWANCPEGGSAVDFAPPVSFSGKELATCHAKEENS